jgi:hypothetical protein
MEIRTTSRCSASPVDAPYEGKGLDVDYLIGTCHDEVNLFAAIIPDIKVSVFGQRARTVIDAAGSSWDEVEATYKVSRPAF